MRSKLLDPCKPVSHIRCSTKVLLKFLVVSDTPSSDAVMTSMTGLASKFSDTSKRLASATPKSMGSKFLTATKVFESRLIVRSSIPNRVNIKRKQIMTSKGLKIILMLYKESHGGPDPREICKRELDTPPPPQKKNQKNPNQPTKQRKRRPSKTPPSKSPRQTSSTSRCRTPWPPPTHHARAVVTKTSSPLLPAPVCARRLAGRVAALIRHQRRVPIVQQRV